MLNPPERDFVAASKGEDTHRKESSLQLRERFASSIFRFAKNIARVLTDPVERACGLRYVSTVLDLHSRDSCNKQHPYSITSSARARNDSGMSRPMAFAVLRLTTISNLVGCSIGISAGFAPRRILSTKSAARR